MKKILAFLLALMMVLVSVAALADGDTNPPANDDQQQENGNGGNGQAADGVSELSPYINGGDPSIDTKADEIVASAATPTKAVNVTIPKKINVKALAGDKHPEVTLEFNVTNSTVALSTVATAPVVTIDSVKLAESETTKDITIHLPSYSAVGIYTYTVEETPTKYAGMVETTGFELKVTVIQYVPEVETETDKPCLQIGGIAIRQEGTKTDEIENLYKAGGLKVTKKVTGNMGDRTKPFPITINLKAPAGKTVASTVTYTKGTETTATAVTWTDGKTAQIKVNLKHDEYIEIHNLPEGVTYTVEEDSTIKRQAGATPTAEEQADADTYKVSGEVTTDDNATISAETQASATIINDKQINIDTGVALDSAVYMLIMALALAGFVALKVCRREDY